MTYVLTDLRVALLTYLASEEACGARKRAKFATAEPPAAESASRVMDVGCRVQDAGCRL